MNDPKDISIVAQSAAHDAATIYAGLHQPGEHFDLAEFQGIHSLLHSHMIQVIDDEREHAVVAAVQTAFPGSQMVPTTPPVPGGEAPFQTPYEQQQMQTGYAQPAQQPYPQQQPVYAPPAQPQGYQPPMVPQTQGGYAQQPPPPAPMAPPAMNLPGRCPRCGNELYDNRQNNAMRRQHGFSLQPDFKCKSQNCDEKTWPPDFQAYKHLPKPPQGWGR